MHYKHYLVVYIKYASFTLYMQFIVHIKQSVHVGSALLAKLY